MTVSFRIIKKVLTGRVCGRKGKLNYGCDQLEAMAEYPQHYDVKEKVPGLQNEDCRNSTISAKC